MGQLLPRKGGKSCASYPPHSSLAAAPGPELRKKGVTSDYKEFKECRGRCDFSLRRETPRAAKRGESEFRTWSGPASTEESLDLIREFEHCKIEQNPLPCVISPPPPPSQSTSLGVMSISRTITHGGLTSPDLGRTFPVKTGGGTSVRGRTRFLSWAPKQSASVLLRDENCAFPPSDPSTLPLGLLDLHCAYLLGLWPRAVQLTVRSRLHARKEMEEGREGGSNRVASTTRGRVRSPSSPPEEVTPPSLLSPKSAFLARN